MLARLRITILLTTLLLLVVLAIGTDLLLSRIERDAEQQGEAQVERVARQAEAVLSRQLTLDDTLLRALPSLLAQSPAGPDALLRSLVERNLGFAALTLRWPDGSRWAGSDATSAATVSQPPPTRPGAVQVLGPFRRTPGDESLICLTRRMAFAGPGELIVTADVPLSLLSSLVRPLGERPGLSLALHGPGGTVPLLPGGLDGSPGTLTLPEANGRAVSLNIAADQGPQLAARRATAFQDLSVVVTLDLAATAMERARMRYRVLAVACSAAVLLLALAFALDAALHQRERIEAERASARMLLENALESMSDGFVMWDAEDRLIACNRRYREMYARTGDAIVVGATFESIIRAGLERGQYPQLGDDPESFVADLVAWHRSNGEPIERLLPDGRWILVTERATPDGGTVGIRTDITELKRANRELAAAHAAAARATEAKSRFLARMSHELRTPLNGVLGLAQALARDPTLSPAHRAQAATLENAGRHLVAVANDVLDLARVESGKLELQAEPVALEPLLQDCLAIIRPAAEARPLRLRMELDPALPAAVTVDPTRLRQLLLNLLANAVKFTPPRGEVRLLARAVAALARPGMAGLRLEVRDTGPGVPPQAREAIFSDFIQLEQGALLGGAGLGLAIARHIAEALGGRIGCEANAEAASGALFWLELALPVAVLAAAPEAAGPPPRQLRLLVADDVAANQAVARALLQSAGHSVDCVGDGAEAVAALSQAAQQGHAYDAVLMDVMMPGVDGLEATRRIRALPGPEARTPVLAVTASAFSTDIASCEAAGMDGHLAKPIERERLLKLLAGLTPAAPHLPPAAPPQLPLLRLRGGQVAVQVPGLDPAAARQLLPEFVREVELAAAALRAAPPSEWAGSAQALAGAAAPLGALRLEALADRLHQAALAGQPEAASLHTQALAVAAETLAAVASPQAAA